MRKWLEGRYLFVPMVLDSWHCSGSWIQCTPLTFFCM